MTGIQALLLWSGVASVAAFLAHVVDKLAAVRQGRRIPESVLHLMALLGGWPGALLGMGLARHKTRKAGFLLVTAGIVVLHAAIGYAAWRRGRSGS